MVPQYRYLTDRSFFLNILKLSNFRTKGEIFDRKVQFSKISTFPFLLILDLEGLSLDGWKSKAIFQPSKTKLVKILIMGKWIAIFEQRTKSESVVLILTSARSRIQPSAPDAPSPEIWPKRNAVSYRTFHFLTIIQLDNLATKKIFNQKFSFNGAKHFLKQVLVHLKISFLIQNIHFEKCPLFLKISFSKYPNFQKYPLF